MISNVKNSGVFFSLKSEYVDILRKEAFSFGFPDSHFGEIVYYRTYSREKENGSKENWYETVERVINGLFTIRKWWFSMHNLPWQENVMQDKALEMSISMLKMQWLPPGRGLQMMGTDYIYERGSMALFNCAYTEIEDLETDITWLADALMCGCGVGVGISEKSQELFPLSKEKATYVIPDSREGWVESLRLLLHSYLTGGIDWEFDCSEIRPYGSPVRGIGGTASGPAPLLELHERVRVFCNQYLKGKINWTRLCADLANAVGNCVVVGNIRRSAEILLGSPYDEVFLNLKNYEKHPERSGWGWMSNNSVRLYNRNDFLRLGDVAERIRTNGEPGILNMVNIQKFGRYGDETYGIDLATGLNPCGEIPLENKELCNLSECFPSRCSSRKEFLNAISHATFYSSTVSLYPTHSPATNAVIARNRRIGVSLSGIAEWIDTWGAPRITRWIKDGYHTVREVNKQTNKEAGIPPSIRVTTIKPSGSISQVAGVPSGMHYPTFSYAVRRIIIDGESTLSYLLKEAGYIWEPVVEFFKPENANGREEYPKYDSFAKGGMKPFKSPTSLIFECPISLGMARPAKAVSAWEQFTLLAMLQREWSDNSVSATISFDLENEGHQIPHMLSAFVPVIKSVSMLPHSDLGAYPQMPYEGITKEEYEDRISLLKDIDWKQLKNSGIDQTSELYCTSDKCQINFEDFLK